MFPHLILKKYILTLSSYLCVGLPNVTCLSGFNTKTMNKFLFSSTRAIFPARLIFLDSVILKKKFGENSSLCRFIHSLASCINFGPIIFLTVQFRTTLSLHSSLKGRGFRCTTTQTIIKQYIPLCFILENFHGK